jgi:hypothetical protein
MEYLIKFSFACAKKNRLTNKTGEITIKSDSPMSINDIKNNNEIKSMIISDLVLKTGLVILLFEIISIKQI